MPRVSQEQIARAKETDLLTYLLNNEPDAIIKKSVNEYSLKEHDSLTISNGKWHWWSRDIGGRTALDFLIKVRGMEFLDAVLFLCGERAAPAFHSPLVVPKPEKRKPETPFELPTPYRDNFRVIAYLLSRGIDREIIDSCIELGTLYESKKLHNCVFVGKDKDGRPQFACLRSTYCGFRQDIDGSDKQYGFFVPVRDKGCRSLFVFESPIDALSHATIDKAGSFGDNWDCCHRLSLSGISILPLMQYLNDNPNIDSVCLCLDNDKTGRKFIGLIKETLKEMPPPQHGNYIVSVSPPPFGKDFNDTLMEITKIKKEQKEQVRSSEAAILI